MSLSKYQMNKQTNKQKNKCCIYEFTIQSIIKQNCSIPPRHKWKEHKIIFKHLFQFVSEFPRKEDSDLIFKFFILQQQKNTKLKRKKITVKSCKL